MTAADEHAPPAILPESKPGFRYTDEGRLIRSDPAKAAVVLKARLAEHGGNASAAARASGVNIRTFARWLRGLERRGFFVRASA